MRRAKCTQCGRSRPKAKMFPARWRWGETMAGPFHHGVDWQCGNQGCVAARQRREAQVRRHMRGDVVFGKWLRQMGGAA